MDTRTAPSSRCPEALRLLPAYVEGELAAPDHRLVAGHLQACPACRSQEVGYRQALGALGAREPERPGDLYAGFAAKLAATQARPVGVRPLRWATALGALVLVAVAGASLPRLLRHAEPANARPAQLTSRSPVSANAARVPAASLAAGPDDVRQALARIGDPDPAGMQRSASSPSGEVAEGTPARATVQPDRPAIRRARRAARIPADVLHPVPGRTIPLVVRRDADAATPRDGHSGSDAALPRPPTDVGGVPVKMVPMTDERVQVGDNWTRVRTAAGYDVRGRKVVNVEVETVGSADSAPAPSSGPQRRSLEGTPDGVDR